MEPVIDSNGEKHPHPDALAKLINKLESYCDSSDKWYYVGMELHELDCSYKSDLASGKVYCDEPLCDTPGCFAGWCMIALNSPFETGSSFLDYEFGIDWLKYFFSLDIAEWAHVNRDIWGNGYGGDMFWYPEAFGEHEKTFPLPVLVEYLSGVHRRLVKHIKDVGLKEGIYECVQ